MALRDLCELFASGGAINVGGDDHGAMAVFGEPFAHFSGGGGFAGALQADDEPDGRRARAELRVRFAAEEVGELVAHDFYNLLIGRELQQHFLAESFFADVGDEFVGDTEIHVAIEKRLANFGEAGVEVLVGELALAAQFLKARCNFSVSVSNMEKPVTRDLFFVTRGKAAFHMSFRWAPNGLRG